MYFEIIAKDWYKRRSPTKSAKPIRVTVDDFQKQANHFCDMTVEFDDGSTKVLKARVIQNQITKQWTVDGMEVAARLIETN